MNNSFVISVCSILLLCYQNAVLGKNAIRKFPKNFTFGVSTAAYQIEGAWDKDGRGLSIWDVHTQREPSPIDDASTGNVATDSYHLYKRDVEMLKELGVDFYRFSIAWPRILPEGYIHEINEAGVAYYNNLIDELLKNNIKPMVTMYHWDLPVNLQLLGGWANPAIVDWFTDYAKVLYEKFGDRVKQWITMNEPKQICTEGYGQDRKAPAINASGIGDYMCAKNLLLAHAKAYHLYESQYKNLQNGTVGISISFKWFEPMSDSEDDVTAARDAKLFDWGIYTHPIFSNTGGFPSIVKKVVETKSAEQGFSRSRLPELSLAEIELIKGSADFLGVNHYSTKLVYRDASLYGMYPVPSLNDDMAAVLAKDPSWPQAQSKWLNEVPWGFYKLLRDIKKLYNNPIVYITENGWSTAGGLVDEGRIQYYRKYLVAMLDAIEKGCDVRGYTAWSLLDNFEWARGYTEKFGLYEVDFSSPGRERTPRKSAFVYKEIIRSRKLDPTFEPPTYIVEAHGNETTLI